jgi:hypothetical protein
MSKILRASHKNQNLRFFYSKIFKGPKPKFFLIPKIPEPEVL